LVFHFCVVRKRDRLRVPFAAGRVAVFFFLHSSASPAFPYFFGLESPSHSLIVLSLLEDPLLHSLTFLVPRRERLLLVVKGLFSVKAVLFFFCVPLPFEVRRDPLLLFSFFPSGAGLSFRPPPPLPDYPSPPGLRPPTFSCSFFLRFKNLPPPPFAAFPCCLSSRLVFGIATLHNHLSQHFLAFRPFCTLAMPDSDLTLSF